MEVKVYNNETMEAYERAKSVLGDELPSRMLNAVKTAAAYELANKTYRDRSGKLRANTRGIKVSRSANESTVEFELGTEYASYVNRRGFSAFNEAGIAARDAIGDEIHDLENKIVSR